jgi:hypothetical protein
MKGRAPFTYLVISIPVFILVASNPEFVLFPMACLYVAHGPFESLVFYQRRLDEKKKRDERQNSEAAKPALVTPFQQKSNPKK